MVKIASARHSGLSVGRHFAPPPPPHSSVNSTFESQLLNVAERQWEKFESATAPMRFGFAGSRSSSYRTPASEPVCEYRIRVCDRSDSPIVLLVRPLPHQTLA